MTYLPDKCRRRVLHGIFADGGVGIVAWTGYISDRARACLHTQECQVSRANTAHKPLDACCCEFVCDGKIPCVSAGDSPWSFSTRVRVHFCLPMRCHASTSQPMSENEHVACVHRGVPAGFRSCLWVYGRDHTLLVLR